MSSQSSRSASSMTTSTLGQLLMQNFATLPDLCSSSEKPNSNNFLADPLAQSVAMYLNKQNGYKIGGVRGSLNPISEQHVERLITDDDHQIAGEIRDYYSKKIMMWNLLGHPLTNFRQDLSTFIHLNDFSEVSDRMIPLIYKLPEFYFQDIKLEDVLLKCIKFNGVVSERTGVKKLTYLDSITKKSKLKVLPTTEYWFHDENKYPVLIRLQQNPLSQFWEKIIQDHYEENKPLTMHAKNYGTCKYRGEINVIVPESYHLQLKL
jgi:hypothetical protein